MPQKPLPAGTGLILDRKLLPLSKIKRHLVDSIDFDELKEAMFKKSEKISKYQEFCKNIQQKHENRSKSTNMKLSRASKLRDNPDNVEEDEAFQTIYHP